MGPRGGHRHRAPLPDVHRRGLPPGSRAVVYREGYAAGHCAGSASGYAAGRADGYAEGYVDGQADTE